MFLYNIRPKNHGVDEHRSSSLSNSADVPFSNTVLVVGVNTAEFDALVLLDAARTKIFGSKYAVIYMITLDGMIILRRE